MSDFTPQKPSLTSAAPTYNTCTTGDRFAATPNGRYMLHYQNGATPTGALKITDQTTVAPEAANGAGAGWADVQVISSLLASTERVVWIDNAARFRDANGYVNLAHTTPTTLKLAIFGPY